MNAEIVLGDRPFEITLRRVFDIAMRFPLHKQLGFIVDVTLAVSGLREYSATPASAVSGGEAAEGKEAEPDDVDRLLAAALRVVRVRDDGEAYQKEVETIMKSSWLDNSLLELGSRMGPFSDALLHERDLYLAWSLKRSKAVNGTKRVVGVVGRAHVPGIVYALQNDPHGAIRFSDLVGGRNTKAFKKTERIRVAAQLLRDTALFGLLAWWVSEHGWILPGAAELLPGGP